VSRDRLYLEQIRERIERIETYTAGGADAFPASLMAQDAVIRSFEVVGEADGGLARGRARRRAQGASQVSLVDERAVVGAAQALCYPGRLLLGMGAPTHR